MPQHEMISMLALNGDKPKEWLPDRMITEQWLHYIKSQQGWQWGSHPFRMEPRYLWHRE